MPCGVETTCRIVELMKASDRPITILEIAQRLGVTYSTARQGIDNLLDTGTPRLAVKELKIPNRKGRPERAYSLAPGDPETSVYWGPNPHRVQSFGRL